MEVNVGLKVEETQSTDSFKVSGRGELHLSILLENMRREGYELAVSKPEVIMKNGENGRLLEPVEEVVISVPDEYSGSVISKLNLRKGLMNYMNSENGFTKLEYLVPTRGYWGIDRNLSMTLVVKDQWSEDSTALKSIKVKYLREIMVWQSHRSRE